MRLTVTMEDGTEYFHDLIKGQIYVGAMEDLLDDYEEKQYAVDLDKIEMNPYEPSFRAPSCFEWEE